MLSDSGRTFVRKIIKLPFQVTGIIVALFCLFQTPLWAKIYKWKDDQGKLHFTDDRAKIPQKYREKVQKFKGVTEPRPKVEEPEQEDEPKEEEGEEPSAAVKPPPEEEPKSPPPPPLAEEEKAAMTAVYKPLIMLWNKHVLLLMGGDPDEKNLKRYVGVAQSSAVDKKAIKKTIGKTEHPLLLEIKSFMKKSGKKDARLKEDNPGLITHVKFYKKRLMKEIPIENGFIKQLHQQLEIKAPSPLITLEEALKAAAEKKARRNKSKQKRKNSQNSSNSSGSSQF
jgi:hypothetical protein